jgi:hypothetical protein
MQSAESKPTFQKGHASFIFCVGVKAKQERAAKELGSKSEATLMEIVTTLFSLQGDISVQMANAVKISNLSYVHTNYLSQVRMQWAESHRVISKSIKAESFSTNENDQQVMK